MTADEVQVSVEDDGLACPEIRRWAETKYRLISLYDELFATGMKYKWHQRVYIDLYGGVRLWAALRAPTRFLIGSPPHCTQGDESIRQIHIL